MASNKSSEGQSGIYKLACASNSRVYIGSAINLLRRWTEHRKHLRSGRHKNPKLQAAWNKYGEEDFSFSTVLLCPVDELIAKEQAEIDCLGIDNLFNVNPIAGSRLGAVVSEKGRANMSASLRGSPGRHCMPHSEETREKLRNRVFTEATRQKMSLAKLGKKRKPFTAETLSRMSKAQKGRVTPAHVLKKWSEDRSGVPWSAARRAAQDLKMQRNQNGF